MKKESRLPCFQGISPTLTARTLKFASQSLIAGVVFGLSSLAAQAVGDRSIGTLVRYPNALYNGNHGNVINITRLNADLPAPYNVVNATANDSSDDDAIAINNAYTYIIDQMATDLASNVNAADEKTWIIYIPHGQFDIEQTLIYNGTAPVAVNGAEALQRIRFVGRSREGSVLKLKDGSAGFELGNQTPVISFAKSNFNNLPSGTNAVSNLTIDIGDDNPGAVGIHYVGANRGRISNVKIESGNVAGYAGILLTHLATQGYFSDITIDGFEHGVRIDSPFRASHQTWEYITLRDISDVGMWVSESSLTVRKLDAQVTNNSAFYLENRNGNGDREDAHLVLLDSLLTQSGSAGGVPAIEMGEGYGHVFARNVDVTGYACSVDKLGCEVNGDIVEYVSSQPVLRDPGSQVSSLNIPIQDVPVPFSSNSMLDVAVTSAYSGTDAQKLQAALNSGKPIVMVASPVLSIDTTLTIPASVKVLDGLFGKINKSGSSPLFQVLSNGGDTLTIRNAAFKGTFEQVGDRTVVLDSCNVPNYSNPNTASKTLFVNNSGGFGKGSSDSNGPSNGMTAFVRFFNVEVPNSEDPNAPRRFHFTTNAATAVILGYKTEKSQSLRVMNGGMLEVLGGVANLPNYGADSDSIIYNEHSTVSYVGATSGQNNDSWVNMVEDIQMTGTVVLNESIFPARAGSAHNVVGLYVSGLHNGALGTYRIENAEFSGNYLRAANGGAGLGLSGTVDDKSLWQVVYDVSTDVYYLENVNYVNRNLVGVDAGSATDVLISNATHGRAKWNFIPSASAEFGFCLENYSLGALAKANNSSSDMVLTTDASSEPEKATWCFILQ